MGAKIHSPLSVGNMTAGRRRHFAVPLVLLASLLLTALASSRARIAVHAEAQANFVGESQRLSAEISRRITQSSYALVGLRASMAASGRLRRQQFRNWVAQRDLIHEFPGIRGLGFVEPVPRVQLAEYIARERADDAPDFAVQTRGESAELWVITHIEPLERNRPAVGLDIGAEQARREGAERAINTGSLALTAPVVLVQDERRGPGWLLFLPVFRPGARLLNAVDRRAALIGLVYAPITVSEVLAPLPAFVEHRLHFQLMDGGAGGPVLYDSAALTAEPGRRSPLWVRTWPLQIAGREMTLRISSTPLFEALLASWTATVVLLAGVALSLLFTLGVSRLQASRDAAEARSQQVSHRLAEHEKLLQLMIDSIPAQLSYWDSSLRCRLTNQATCAALGRSRDELLDTPLATASQGVKLLAQLQPAIDAALLGNAQQVEHSETRADGHVQTTLTHVLPDRRGDDIRGLVILTLDISELKRAQNAAQQASQAKSKFLSSMSHEMRTPMNAAIGMLELLRSTPLNARQDDYARKAERAARSLLALINDILDFSKIEAGKMALDPRPFSMRTLLDDVSILLAVSVGEKPVAVRIVCDPSVPPLLFGDELRLRQILTNLGDNAIKFTHRGEIEVRVDRLADADGAVDLELSVRDTGIGISREAQARLFDDYVQASDSTTRRFGGTGLGLSICRQLSALMGGELQVESVPGIGSRFFLRIRLPLPQGAAADSSRAPARNEDATAQPLAGLRLLLVEDNELNQQLARELLLARGASVTVASNGLLAVQRLEGAEDEFDAVLMDVQMPVMDGYVATKIIRGKLGKRLPIIAMTANAFDKDREAAKQAGMDDHLAKPIDTRELVDTLLLHISRRQRRSNETLPTIGQKPVSEPEKFLDTAAAIQRMGGDRELYFSLVPTLCDRLRELDVQLQLPAESLPPAECTRVLHTLCGMAGTMGACTLAALAKAAEQKCLATDLPPDPATMLTVRQAIALTLSSFASLTDLTAPGARHPQPSSA